MLKPTGYRVLVKRIDAPKPTSTLIEIPDTADGEKSPYALVLAVSSKITDVKVADTVILAPYCGSPVTVELDGEKIEAQVVMHDQRPGQTDDVLAVVEE